MKIGRNATTGQFTTVREAIRKPSTHVVETVNRGKPDNAPNPKGK